MMARLKDRRSARSAVLICHFYSLDCSNKRAGCLKSLKRRCTSGFMYARSEGLLRLLWPSQAAFLRFT